MKTKKLNKWQKITELQEHLDKSSWLETMSEDDKRQLTCLTHAPHIGYRAWIFQYKGVLVVLWDEGNGHYAYFTSVNWIELIKAEIACFVDEISWKLTKKKEGVR